MKIVKKIREVVLLMLFISIPYLSMEDRNQNADGQLSRLESSRDQNKVLDPYQNGLFANKKNLESTVTHQRDNRHLFHLNGFTVKENDNEFDLDKYIEKQKIYGQNLTMVRPSMNKKSSLDSDSSITSVVDHYLHCNKNLPQNQSNGFSDSLANYLSQVQIKAQPVIEPQGFALKMQSQGFGLTMQPQGFPLQTQSQGFGQPIQSQAGKKLEFAPKIQSQSPIKPEVNVPSMGSPIKPEVNVPSMGSPIKPVFVQGSPLLQGSLRDSPKKLGSGVEATKNSAFSKVQPGVGRPPLDLPRQRLFQLQSQVEFPVPTKLDQRHRQLFDKTKAIKKEIEKKCLCAEFLFIEMLRNEFKKNLNKNLNKNSPMDIKKYLKNQQSAIVNTMNSEKNKYDSFYKPDCLLNGEESVLSKDIHCLYSKYDYYLPNSNTFTLEYNNNEFSL
jgi:hypothetical protein